MKGTVKYVGRVYAKVNGKYIECTETIDQLEEKVKKYESALDKIATGAQPANDRESWIFVQIATDIAREAVS